MTISQLRIRIYGILRPLLLDPSSTPDGKPVSTKTLKKEHDSIFLNPLSGAYLTDNPYYDIEISKNLPDASMVCDFCHKHHSDNCLLDFKDNDYTIDQILQMIKHDRELELTINWKATANATKVNFKKIEAPDWIKVDLDEELSSRLPNEKILSN